MNRRRLLTGMCAGFATSIGGCTGGSNNGDETDGTGDDEANGSTMRILSSVSVDDDPEPLAFDVEILDDRLTGSAVPTVEIAVENTGDETASWFYGGSVSELPFPQGIGSDPGGLVIGLADTVTAQLLEPDEGCARVEWFDRDDGQMEARADAGESFTDRYAISGNEAALDDLCPESTTYRFEFDYRDSGRGDSRFRWIDDGDGTLRCIERFEPSVPVLRC